MHVRKIIPLFILATSLVAGTALANEDIAKKNGCMACHGVDKKIVGPAYKDVAAKYKGDAKALAHLETVIHQGGKGVWGQVAMPPQTKLSAGDVKALAQWVLSL